ncbi:MAG: Peripla BP 6 protein [Anaerolineales bacterium]|nr:Peripla BP 6 protein [Anaerolineales bacterium]
MKSRSQTRTRIPFLAAAAVMGGLLACSLPQLQPTSEVIFEPTIVLTQVPAVQPTAPPTQPVSPPASTAAVAAGQVVLHQPFAIIVAYVGPQTGTGSALFTPLQQAGQKAIEDHGPVHGFGVNLIAFNDFCTEAGGEAAAQQIAADEHIVAVLGPVCSNGAIGALPVLQTANIVMISGSATIPDLSVYGPSVFHRTLLDDDQVDTLGYPSQIYIEDLPAVQTWLADFEAWGGGLLETGLNHFSPYQYDATGVLLRALDLSSQALNDGSLLIDREALRAAVRSTTNYPGVTGYITFEANGDRAP